MNKKRNRLVSSGDESDCEEGWKRRVKDGDRCKCFFLTWSAPTEDCAKKFKKPTEMTRKSFARVLESISNDALSESRTVGNLSLGNISIFKEEHFSGQPHYHALLCFTDKVRCGHRIEEILSQKHNIKCYIEVANGGTRPVDRILHYVLVPSTEKPYVDKSPYFSDPGIVTDRLRDIVARATSRLWNGMASSDEIFKFISDKPTVTSYDTLLTLIESRPGDVIARRISKFVNNNICKAQEVIDGLIERRDRKKSQKESELTPKAYFLYKSRSSTKCCCPAGGTRLESDIDFLEEYHGRANTEAVFTFIDKYLSDTLPTVGRPRNLMLLGVPGAGKSTLTDLIREFVPAKRIFEPVLNTSTPYALLSPNSVLVAIDDFRFSSRVPISSTLQWLEGRGFGVDIKNQQPKYHKTGPPWMISANYAEQNTKSDGWKPIDIKAFQDRCWVSYLNAPIPKDKYVPDLHKKMTNCAFCKVNAITKRCPTLRKMVESPAPSP